MTCPVHPEVELRRELHETGFCQKCLRHYPMCCKTQYMDMCDRLEGHEPPHRNFQGREWTDDWTQAYR